MRSLGLSLLTAAALAALASPVAALEGPPIGGGDCESDPAGCGGGGPPPQLPSFSFGAFSGGSYTIFPDGQNQRDGYERDGTTNYFLSGTNTFTPYTGTLTVGGYGSQATLLATKTPAPTVTATASNVGGGAHPAESEIALTYSVVVHAKDQAAADALSPFLTISGAIATASGSMMLAATGQAYSQGGARTGDSQTLAPSLTKATYLTCDPTPYTNQGTGGCGTHGYSIDVNFVNGSAYSNVGPLDFLSTITLDAFVHAGPTGLGIYEGSGSAYVDPTITLNPLLDPALYSLYIGSNPPATGAVPEPASWAMMLFGFGLTGLAARRTTRRSAVLA